MEEEEITEEFIRSHETLKTKGHYDGPFPDIAAALGYTIYMHQRHAIFENAQFANREIVCMYVLGKLMLNEYEQACFSENYERGFYEGQVAITKQLYQLAQFGDFKAIQLYLESRNALVNNKRQEGSPVQIFLSEESNEPIDIGSNPSPLMIN